MARPSVVTPETRAAIERVTAGLGEGATVAALHAALAAEGVNLSRATLSRFRAGRFDGQRSAPAASSAAALSADDLTPAALADELQRRYVETRAVLDAVRAEAMTGGPALSRWLKALGDLGATAERLARMVPPAPPDPATDPECVEARKAIVGAVARFLEQQAGRT